MNYQGADPVRIHPRRTHPDLAEILTAEPGGKPRDDESGDGAINRVATASVTKSESTIAPIRAGARVIRGSARAGSHIIRSAPWASLTKL